jgi:hypothetical protein
MANSDIELLEPIKFIRGSTRRRIELPEEIRLARESPAYWWFRCLMASDEYRFCCDHSGRGELADTYKKFGNIFSYPNFDIWWRKHGRFLFIQEKIRKVKAINEEAFKRSNIEGDKLILEVPLSIRKQTAMRQISLLLKKAYEGREVDIQKNSTAQVKFVKSKIRMTTVELLLKIHKLRERNPRLTLNEIGRKAGIELDLFARTTNDDDMDNSDYEMTRRMTIAVSRYLKQARHLIDNAAHGVFPSIKPRT